MNRRQGTAGLTLAAVAGAVFALATPAQATMVAGPDKCANTVSAADLAAGAGTPTATVDSAADAAVAGYKQAHDQARSSTAADPATASRKRTEAGQARPSCAGSGTVRPNATTGSGYGYISWMYHYGQDTGSWCGEATVEAISSTVPGPSPLGLAQSTIAAWLGNGPYDGTSTGQMVNALNHYVGVPDFGWNFYEMKFMDYNPTGAQRSQFLSDIQVDVNSYNTPMAGDAWEVVGGPHLVGHPNQEIFHWFAIGGWDTNSSKIWYTDSATTVWSSVPAYSWFDMYTAETIMGGRGYVG